MYDGKPFTASLKLGYQEISSIEIPHSIFRFIIPFREI